MPEGTVSGGVRKIDAPEAEPIDVMALVNRRLKVRVALFIAATAACIAGVAIGISNL